MSGIWAKTVLRSRNTAAPDCVLSTLLVRLPTVLLAEFNTHRAFSRNAASTRAIPTERLIEQVESDPFIPLHWGANQKGMQASAECSERIELTSLLGDDDTGYFSHAESYGREDAWLNARSRAVEMARAFAAAGYHKQIAGRLLAPFMYTIVCASATEWDNFLELRDHPDAEPHMQLLARAIRAELEQDDNIKTLRPGEWHLPFVTDDEWKGQSSPREDGDPDIDTMNLVKLSVARCASTSYKTVDGFDMTLDRAAALHDRLVGSRPIHASPTEHVAQADHLKSSLEDWKFTRPEQHRNFRGFRQYRAMIEETA